MQVILTHEQADFDAIASVLGAHLINDIAVPVLPRRMNRNVRAFITLYGSDLPFIDPRDLPSESIDAITMVDTQSMISVKGMRNTTQIYVVDHHPLKEDIPAHWMISISETGANTTIFVETISERDLPITTIQATLLLIGIYEDTGSLTYTRTTSRDLHAASFLLENGASLSIAANFLNLPLSKEQQEIFEQLREQAEFIQVHGHTIVITSGDALMLDEELSTVAHKLRDMLDPDALFVLVNTKGGIQMIARSTTDYINVADITEQFGGGGHERAAAGLIKDRSMDHIYDELIRILPDHVQPAISVAQIMSRDPQLLPPDTPVEEAAKRMQRYGYEGFPVVHNGKVEGLLTRRAVDRALSHKLHLKASSLMEAGNYTIKPDDSIEHLQRLMTDSGWGQIPVHDPVTGNIIGIVTRTDLLKTLHSQAKWKAYQNIATLLERALAPARLVLLKAVAIIACKYHAALYIVGGFVRDLLMDRPSVDFDLVVEGDAITLAHDLVDLYGGRITSHRRFGTAKWLIKGIRHELLNKLFNSINIPVNHPENYCYEQLPEYLDLITARTEFYDHPTALPTVERGSIKLDLHRRDFTINTLALRLDGHHYGELYDYWGGLNDLRNNIVRVLHSLSFIDDPTRILRAIRFEQRFNFKIEERTLALLKEAIPILDRVSGDRIRHEINNILIEDRVIEMLYRLDDLGVLQAIHPDLLWDDWLRLKIDSLLNNIPEQEWCLPDQDRLTYIRDMIYILWLLRTTETGARGIFDKIRLPANRMKVINEARNIWRVLPKLKGSKPSAVVANLDGYSTQAIYAVYLASDDEVCKAELQNYTFKWRQISSKIDGNSLKIYGIPPSSEYRRILKQLREAWLDGVISSADEELDFLKYLINEKSTRK